MRARARQGVAMPLVFGVSELARRCALSRGVLMRLLRGHKVELLRSGKAVFVTAFELEEKLPTLWASFATVGLYSSPLARR